MRGKAARQATMLTAITPGALVPQHHPIRRIKPMVDRALTQLSPTVRPGRSSVDTAGAPIESLPADGLVLGTQPAAIL